MIGKRVLYYIPVDSIRFYVTGTRVPLSNEKCKPVSVPFITRRYYVIQVPIRHGYHLRVPGYAQTREGP